MEAESGGLEVTESDIKVGKVGVQVMEEGWTWMVGAGIEAVEVGWRPWGAGTLAMGACVSGVGCQQPSPSPVALGLAKVLFARRGQRHGPASGEEEGVGQN